MKIEMRSRLATGITLLAVLSWIQSSCAQKAQSKNETLDQGTVQMLSNILESLDTFRNDRLRDLEKIRISTPDGNTTTVTRLDDLSQMPSNSSVSEHIKALKEGIMGHNPVKKTFGYKVTVYTSPIGENGKDSKPVVVTQYVGGDMKPTRRVDESDDLQESANHPDRQLVHSSDSAHLPIQVSVLATGGGEGSESSAAKGAKDHNRETEHSESSEKGHQNGHSLRTQLAKGHDHERHSAKSDEHHKETEKESHRHDTQAHDKGGASQQGIRERTEIEYYEREHFLDTEYDKAKSGHDKTHGVKEHESHNDHDSHEDRKVHDQDNIHNHKLQEKGSTGQKAGIDSHSRYIPPLYHPDQPHVVHKDHLLHEDSLAAKEDSGSSKLHHLEESKGHKEHNSEKDHHSEEKDQGYLDKDKGRRKEGYRERGYKITAEREYFLNDAHHDKGTASHTSGHKLKDEEGAAHASKEGERDRGFVKEAKEEEAHDAAYDAKGKRFYDGEAHSEGFESEKSSASSGGEKKQKEEVIPLAPPVVNYVEPDHHHSHLYPPLPIVYAPSNDRAQAVLAYPPEDLPPQKTSNSHSVSYSNRPVRNEDDSRKPQQPLGGYDDDENLESSTGYRGHASYKKRHPSPLVASIRDNVRKDVHSKPPSYAKEEASAENSVPSSGNSVRFPDEDRKYSKESSDETDFHREEPPKTYTESPDFELGRRRPDSKEVYFQKSHPNPTNSNEQYRHTPQKDVVKFEQERRQPESKEVYFHKEILSQPDPTNSNEQYRLIPTKKDVVYLEDSKRKRPPHTGNPPSLQSHRPREQNSRLLYVQGAQNADKLLRTVDRNVYPNIQNGGNPTVGELIQEIARYPQSQEVQRYPQRNANDNSELAYADLHQIYNPNPERQIRNQQPYRSPTHQQNHQQQLIAKYNHLIQKAHQQQQQQSGEAGLDHLQPHVNHRPDLLQLQKQQQQVPRTVSDLELLQQQTKPPFSPVVLLSRGPPSQKQNQAVDVWYTRPRN